MPSLERFFNPQMRVFSANITSMPSARLYFFEAGSTTPKATYADKQGETPNANPVIASSTGSFPPIFLDGLYRVELRSSANIVQPGWPIDNVGQDTPVVPFGPWVEINTYNEGEVVTGSNGNWYRSIGDLNLGNDPISSPSKWEAIPIPVASSFTSDASWASFSDDGNQISLDVDMPGLVDQIEATLDAVDGNLAVAGDITSAGTIASTDVLSGSNLNSGGSFTPTIIGTSSAGVGTYSAQYGDYSRVGNYVIGSISLAWSAHTGTGNIDISGLPVVASSPGETYAGGACVFQCGLLTYGAGKQITGAIIHNTQAIRLFGIENNTSNSAVAMDTSGSISLTFMYRVAP